MIKKITRTSSLLLILILIYSCNTRPAIMILPGQHAQLKFSLRDGLGNVKTSFGTNENFEFYCSILNTGEDDITLRYEKNCTGVIFIVFNSSNNIVGTSIDGLECYDLTHSVTFSTNESVTEKQFWFNNFHPTLPPGSYQASAQSYYITASGGITIPFDERVNFTVTP